MCARGVNDVAGERRGLNERAAVGSKLLSQVDGVEHAELCGGQREEENDERCSELLGWHRDD